jgi:hypothetical protein
MLFTYHALDKDGHEREGTVEALSMDVAGCSENSANDGYWAFQACL